MKGLDITGENLEDLLAYDDLFLDYFNAFLALPAFPQPLQYDRLAGNFRNVPGTTYSLTGSAQSRMTTPLYGATDDEREQQLEWAKDERLPLFMKTKLFREFKLSKLLLRPLDDRYSASRGSSRNIRGYSRQTGSYLSSLSNSAAHDADEFSWSDYRAELFRYQRPGSRALSLPILQGEFSSNYTSTGFTSTTTTTEQGYSQGSMPTGLTESKKTNLIKWHNTQLQLGMGDSPYSNGLSQNSKESKDVTFSRHETLVSIHEDSLNSDTSSSLEKSHFKTKRPKASGDTTSVKFQQEPHRALSAPVNYEEFQKQPPYKDFDFLFGEDELDNDQAYVSFGEDAAANEEQTEEAMKNLEGKHQMTYQQMKEEALGSAVGLREFFNFLSGTAGKKMADYWLDCEFYKDSMEDFDEIRNVATRNRLFRDIKDRYRLNFTNDAQEQMLKAASNANLSHTIFIRTQYDVLRRLRAYWVPRFIIHKGRVDGFGLYLENDMDKSRPESRLSVLFPSISLVNSIPVKPDDILSIVKTMKWDFISQAGRKLDSRIKSAKRKSKEDYETQVITPTRTIQEILVLALTSDKAAGGPFNSYLEKIKDMQLLSNMMFWQDVTEYGMAEDRSADRLLRMVHAWDIYNKYIASDSIFNIGATEAERNNIYSILINTKDFVSATLFDSAKNHAVDLLEQSWIRYLKEDLKTFLECSVSHRDTQGPPGTADDIEVFVQDGRIIVRRPIKRMTNSNRAMLMSAQESIDSTERELRRKKAIEKRRIMEKERRKAVRAARQRLKEMKLAKNKPETIEEVENEEEGKGEPDYYAEVDGNEEGDGANKQKKPVTFVNMSKNKGLMAIFKKYLSDQQERKDLVNMINLFHELHNYQVINGVGAKHKKDVQATLIFKTYFDPKSKKAVTLTDRITARLGVEKERPRSPTLRETHSFILPLIEDAFKEFWQTQVEQMGITAEDIAHLSASELAMKLGDTDLKAGGKNRRMRKDSTFLSASSSLLSSSQPALVKRDSKMLSKSDSKISLHRSGSKLSESVLGSEDQPVVVDAPSGAETSRSKKKKKKKKKAGGRAQPSKEDKIDFLLSLNQSAMGHLPLHMLFYYRYLQRWGEEDGFPMLDKDLIFYIEVQKFKECSHEFANEELMRKKVQAISDTFLDSAYPPPLQIDVPPDLHQKMVKTAQRYAQGKEITPNLFDEAQYLVFKELLPYWAGFKKQYTPPEDPNKRPLTKRQKLLRKRLEMFETMPAPTHDFKLPKLPDAPVGSMTFSLTEGVKWRLEEFTDRSGEEYGASQQQGPNPPSRMRSNQSMTSVNSITGAAS
ncbi:uncharacterized protein LOC141902488 [Tubulanus polymorphus]|uniref:uncharacterized protein LOC141902488 n=1 Tax=Tubulanus polymorphus TaxID=672921 RepID=UPI003DA40F44